jgi:hypothetical protein
MKRAALVLVVVAMVCFPLNFVHAATQYTCTVEQAGAVMGNKAGTKIVVKDDNSIIRTFIVTDQNRSREFLAIALTAMSAGKKVKCTVKENPPAAPVLSSMLMLNQ